MRRAKLTPENARDMYEDIIDRVVGDRGGADQPEPAQPEAQDSSQAPQSPRKRAGQKQPADQPETPPRRIKATFYLTPRDIVTIDRIQTEEFLRTGKKPQRSEIVSRALQLLAERELNEAPS